MDMKKRYSRRNGDAMIIENTGYNFKTTDLYFIDIRDLGISNPSA